MSTEKCPRCAGAGGWEKALSSTNYTWVKCPDCAPKGEHMSTEQEREAFEDWRNGWDAFAQLGRMCLVGNDEYSDDETQAAWEAWQTCAALEAQVPSKPPGIDALQCVISSLRDTAHISDEEGELTNELRQFRDWAMLAAAPSAPERKPLTDEQITNTVRNLGWGQNDFDLEEIVDVARAIEQAHGIGEV